MNIYVTEVRGPQEEGSHPITVRSELTKTKKSIHIRIHEGLTFQIIRNTAVTINPSANNVSVWWRIERGDNITDFAETPDNFNLLRHNKIEETVFVDDIAFVFQEDHPGILIPATNIQTIAFILAKRTHLIYSTIKEFKRENKNVIYNITESCITEYGDIADSHEIPKGVDCG